MIFPWDKEIFLKAMKHAIGIGVVGIAIILIGWGEIVPADIFGLGVSVPLIAYLIHVVMIIDRDHKNQKKDE